MMMRLPSRGALSRLAALVSEQPDGAPARSRGRTHVARTTLSQAIAEELVRRINSGQYTPGDRLPTENDLMDEFGVGRSSARESMLALASRGIVDIRPGRGARLMAVRSDQALPRELIARLLEAQTTDELYEFRAHVEQDVAGLAARRATAPEIEALYSNIDRYRQTIQSGDALFDLDVEFHQLVAAAAHNVVFEKVLNELTDLLNFVRREIHSIEGATERALVEHAAIADALAAGDADAAKDAMYRHIESALRTLRERPLGAVPATEGTRAPASAGGQSQRLS